MPAESAATAIDTAFDPATPNYTPLPIASVPQQPSQVVTTDQVNGPNGSVDNGGAVDRLMAQRYAAANAWSNQTFGMPLVAPSVDNVLSHWGVFILGGFVGGYHGYQRSGGKTLPTAGYAVAGALFPLITLGVGLLQGYGKRRGR